MVSVGDVGSERRVQNLAAGLIGEKSTDAINGSQLYATNKAVEALQTGGAGIVQYSNADSPTTPNGGTITFTDGTVGNRSCTLTCHGKALWRVALTGNAEASRERLFASLDERIRCVRQGPDGWVYLLTDSGKLIRIVAAISDSCFNLFYICSVCQVLYFGFPFAIIYRCLQHSIVTLHISFNSCFTNST